MNLKTSEIQKILYNVSIRGIVIFFILLNFVITAFLFQDNQNGKIMYTSSGYRALHQELKDMNTKEALDYVNDINDKLKHDKTYQLRYERTHELERVLLTRVMEDIRKCLEYHSMIEEIDKNVEEFYASGRAALSGKYVVRNYQQMKKDYRNIAHITPVYGPSKGVELFSQNVVTDFLVLALLLIVIIQIFTKERETKELLLYKTTFRGKRRLGWAKMTVISVSVIFLVIVFYGMNLLLAFGMYGLGNLDRALQSVPLFSTSVFPISVGQYLLLFFCLKVLSFLCIGMIIYSLAVACKKPQMLYLGTLLFMGISMILYIGIEINSRWNVIKFSNFYSILRVEQLFKYQNLNVSGVPCSLGSVYLTFVAVCLFIAIYMGTTLFKVQREAEVRADSVGARVRVDFFARCSSLFLHESYKLLINGRILVLLILFTVFIVAADKPLDEEFFLEQDAYYNTYIDRLHGPVSISKMEYLDRQENLFQIAGRQYEKGLLSEAAYSERMKSYEAFSRIYNEKAPYLMAVDGHFIREDGYQLLTGGDAARNKDIKMAILAAAMVILPFSYLYGTEYQQRTSVFLHTYYCGGMVTAKRKIGLGMLVLTYIYILVYAPIYSKVYHAFGFNDLSVPACSLENLSLFPNTVSMGEYLAMVAVMRYLGLGLILLFLCLISRYTKSFIGNCVCGIIVILVPLVFAYLDVPCMKYVLFNPLLIGNVFGY